MVTRVILALFLVVLSRALDNGFLKPAMGWNPWNCFGQDRSGHWKFPHKGVHGFNDTVIRQTTDALVSTGLSAAGYKYVNLDCGWTTGFRDKETGRQIVNKDKYPNGMKALGDYIHSKGLKYGIYTSASTSQCCSKFYTGANDGSLDHEKVDAQMYVEFGVDYLKFDGCGQEQRAYPAMRDALNASGRPVIISVNGFDMTKVSQAGEFANSWRTTPDDTHGLAESLAPRAMLNNKYAAFARPGQFNDADMLEVGNMVLLGDTTAARSHFSLWCVMKSPLIIGTDVTQIKPEALSILSNPEAIAINQDALGLQAFVVWQSSDTVSSNGHPKFPPVPKLSVWAGPLEGGAFTALLLNMGSKASSIKLTRDMLTKSTANAPHVGPPAASLEMRDIWQKKSLGTFQDEWEGTVKPQDVVLLKLSPATTPDFMTV